MNASYRILLVLMSFAAVAGTLEGCASDGASKRPASLDDSATEEGAPTEPEANAEAEGPPAGQDAARPAERSPAEHESTHDAPTLPWPFAADEGGRAGADAAPPVPQRPPGIHTSRARRFGLRPTLDSVALRTCIEQGQCTRATAQALSALVPPAEHSRLLDVAVVRLPDSPTLMVLVLAQGPTGPADIPPPIVVVDDAGFSPALRARAREMVETLAERAPQTRLTTLTEHGVRGSSPVDATTLDEAFAASRPTSVMPLRTTDVQTVLRDQPPSAPLLLLTQRNAGDVLRALGDRTVSVVNLAGDTDESSNPMHSRHVAQTPARWVANSLFVTCPRPALSVTFTGTDGVVRATSGPLTTTSLRPGALASGNRTAMLLEFTPDPTAPEDEANDDDAVVTVGANATLRCDGAPPPERVARAHAEVTALADVHGAVRDALALALLARGQRERLTALGLSVPTGAARGAL